MHFYYLCNVLCSPCFVGYPHIDYFSLCIMYSVLWLIGFLNFMFRLFSFYDRAMCSHEKSHFKIATIVIN